MRLLSQFKDSLVHESKVAMNETIFAVFSENSENLVSKNMHFWYAENVGTKNTTQILHCNF